MALKMVVTVKQVPDTHNVSGDAMKPDGTVNRAILPTIFNPEDLNALEEALKIKEIFGGTITVLTMGPAKALEVLKECLYRGADDVILISDRRFAGADTLATSYVLKCAIDRIGNVDLVLCGRQAIDGDTAQVGPQIAEKLGINQLTCISDVVDVAKGSITVKRSVESGHEVVKSKFPVLLTVTGEANEPRSPSAKLMMKYKNVDTKSSYDDVYTEDSINTAEILEHVKEWNLESVGAELEQCGLKGSPTKVKKIESVVLTASQVKEIPNHDVGIKGLMDELTTEHIIG